MVLGGATTDKSYNLRVAHWPSEVSTYNLSGGTITFSQPPGSGSPSTSADPEVAGGTYVGIDGVGIFNQSGGSMSTPWVVLDNRGATTIGTTTSAYNLSSGTLGLSSQWGVIGRTLTLVVWSAIAWQGNRPGTTGQSRCRRTERRGGTRAVRDPRTIRGSRLGTRRSSARTSLARGTDRARGSRRLA